MKPRLIIDTRERKPLSFTINKKYDIVNEKLDFGDYGLEIDGELVCCFERKSATDLISTVSSDHNRFKHEVMRAKGNSAVFYVAVECSYMDILNKNFPYSNRTKVKGETIAKIIHTMHIKYNLPFFFFNNRQEMQIFIEGTFASFIKGSRPL